MPDCKRCGDVRINGRDGLCRPCARAQYAVESGFCPRCLGTQRTAERREGKLYTAHCRECPEDATEWHSGDYAHLRNDLGESVSKVIRLDN